MRRYAWLARRSTVTVAGTLTIFPATHVGVHVLRRKRPVAVAFAEPQPFPRSPVRRAFASPHASVYAAGGLTARVPQSYTTTLWEAARAAWAAPTPAAGAAVATGPADRLGRRRRSRGAWRSFRSRAARVSRTRMLVPGRHDPVARELRAGNGPDSV